MNFDIQKLWEDNQSLLISSGLNILYAIRNVGRQKNYEYFFEYFDIKGH